MDAQQLTLKQIGPLAPATGGPGQGPLIQSRGDRIDYYEHIVLPPRVTASDAAPTHPARTPSRRDQGDTRTPDNGSIIHRSMTGTTGVALLLAALQFVVGYEWLVSGVDKLLDGRFPDQLGSLMASNATGSRLPDFFAQFLQQVVLPNSYAFGWIVELGETLTGAGLLTGTLITLLGSRLRERPTAIGARRAWSIVGALTFVAALASLAMAVNYYLLDGLPAPWFQPSFAFGGAIDSSLLLALFSFVILLGRLVTGWQRSRRPQSDEVWQSATGDRRATDDRERPAAA